VLPGLLLSAGAESEQRASVGVARRV
jgi:hypothetical protein